MDIAIVGIHLYKCDTNKYIGRLAGDMPTSQLEHEPGPAQGVDRRTPRALAFLPHVGRAEQMGAWRRTRRFRFIDSGIMKNVGEIIGA